MEFEYFYHLITEGRDTRINYISYKNSIRKLYDRLNRQDLSEEAVREYKEIFHEGIEAATRELTLDDESWPETFA